MWDRTNFKLSGDNFYPPKNTEINVRTGTASSTDYVPTIDAKILTLYAIIARIIASKLAQTQHILFVQLLLVDGRKGI